MTHRSFGKRGSKLLASRTLDDLAGSVIHQRYIDAAKAASAAFTRAGIHHVLVGGLAVGVRGYERATGDVDFLVGEEAFDHHGLIVSPKAGLPIRYGTVTIDWVSMEPNDQMVLDSFLEMPAGDEVPVIPIEALVYMKLVASRRKDLADVVELVKAGIDVAKVRKYLKEIGRYAAEFDHLVGEAEEEGR